MINEWNWRYRWFGFFAPFPSFIFFYFGHLKATNNLHTCNIHLWFHGYFMCNIIEVASYCISNSFYGHYSNYTYIRPYIEANLIFHFVLCVYNLALKPTHTYIWQHKEIKIAFEHYHFDWSDMDAHHTCVQRGNEQISTVCYVQIGLAVTSIYKYIYLLVGNVVVFF